MMITAVKAIALMIFFGVTLGLIYPSYGQKKIALDKEKKKDETICSNKENCLQDK